MDKHFRCKFHSKRHPLSLRLIDEYSSKAHARRHCLPKSYFESFLTTAATTLSLQLLTF
ncbi:hypothetical protein SLEP1_g59214 [Rubroshorea leprosula]|uniref:Uncharacterized protein n=1 Tax=Rubroshorea leprosula TaxID=152421 RepID=A0AAV5MRP4_9ROSI|nr:hypothetical protein SLEP1_g59214 [Rubroshorea leprosula]